MQNFIRKIHKRWRKLNFTVIDYLFIGVFVIALAGFFFFFKRESVSLTVTFKVTDKDVLYAINSPTNEYAERFTVGDTEKSETGEVVAEIVNVESYNITPTERVVYLDVKVKAVYDARKNQYSMRGKPIVFGQPFTFSFSQVYVPAIVVGLPEQNQNTSPTITIVEAQLKEQDRQFSDVYGVPSYVADAVKVGDSVTDSNGNVLAKVTGVRVAPAVRTITNATGHIFTVNDPVLKDVFYTLELKTFTSNNTTYMFDYLPVAVNQTVPLNFKHISVFPVITKVH